MTRKIIRIALCAFVAALCLVVSPVAALAQDDGSELPVYPGPFDGSGEETADTGTADDGPFDNGSGLPLYPGPFDGSADQTDDAAVTTVDADGSDEQVLGVSVEASASVAQPGDTAAGLANTGSEVEPIVAVSIGLLSVGGAVLVSSRRRLRDLFS